MNKEIISDVIIYNFLNKLLERYNINIKNSNIQKMLTIKHIVSLLNEKDKKEIIKRGKKYCISDSLICCQSYPLSISGLRGLHHLATYRILNSLPIHLKSKKYKNIEMANLTAAIEYIYRKTLKKDIKPLSFIRGVGGIIPRVDMLMKGVKEIKNNKELYYFLKSSKKDSILIFFIALITFFEIYSSTEHLKKCWEK